jgi:hypothetical protein
VKGPFHQFEASTITSADAVFATIYDELKDLTNASLLTLRARVRFKKHLLGDRCGIYEEAQWSSTERVMR